MKRYLLVGGLALMTSGAVAQYQPYPYPQPGYPQPRYPQQYPQYPQQQYPQPYPPQQWGYPDQSQYQRNQYASVLQLSERDDGRSYTIGVGGEIRVQLSQSAGTPYDWDLRNDDHVALIGAPITRDISNGRVYGGPQLREFRLRVTRPGRFALIFALRSQRGGNYEAPVQRVLFTIDARQATGYLPRPDRDDNYYPTPRPYPDQGQYNSFPRPYPNRQRDEEMVDGPDTVEPLTRGDAGRSRDLPVGSEQTIALSSNITTGYQWRVTNADNVSLTGPIKYEAAAAPRGMVGRGGTSLISFRVNRRGPARLVLDYTGGPGRPGEQLSFFFQGI